MALRRAIVSGWDSVNSVPKGVTPASDFRAGLAPLAMREGVLYTAEDACEASGTATMAVQLQPFTSAIVSPLGGYYYVTADDVASVELAAADSSNARIDVIYVMQEDYQVDPTKVDSEVVLSKVTGTPAVSPSAPSVPAGALALWECEVPAGAVNTLDGVVFTPLFDWTVPVGGIVPFRTVAEMDLELSLPPSTRATVLADNADYIFDGISWDGMTPGTIVARTNYGVDSQTLLTKFPSGLCVAQVTLSKASGALANDTIMADLPAGFRPTVRTRGGATLWASGNPGGFDIYTNGEIHVMNANGVGGVSLVTFAVSYMAAS